MRRHRLGLASLLCFACAGPAAAQALAPDAGAGPGVAASTSPISVSTYHYDQMRTGWNRNETALTASNVKSASFGVQHGVALDDQVDAQPLIVAGQSITGGTKPGTYEVVYVVTENNTVYAIDAATGTVLLKRSLGKAVPKAMLPGQCNNNGSQVGINSTPVIDLTTGTMYVMAYTLVNNVQTYQLHGLDLATLSDKVKAVTVKASHALSNGTIYNFDAAVSRQRPALALANGNVYAGFGSFCDLDGGFTRGWLLGWKTGTTLTPLNAVQLNDQKPADSTTHFFLSSVWMSGYGPAVAPGGDILFVTGNSHSSSTSYQPPLNIQESVVKVLPDLSTGPVDWFTPSGSTNGVQALDAADRDFGSGGVMVVPEIAGQTKFAVAAGKAGLMYVMNRDSLGKFQQGPGGTDKVLGTYSIGTCFCGPSYFIGADSVRRIVTSGGTLLKIWKISTTATPTLTGQSGSYAALASGQSGGFMTTVSSNGVTAHSAIVWAVAHPLKADTTHKVHLYAFDAGASTSNTGPIFSAVAGSWPNTSGTANIVPVVANGRVYVASFKALNIFALNGHQPPVLGAAPTTQQPVGQAGPAGVITAVGTGQITLRTTTGAVVVVDTTPAEQASTSIPLVLGDAVYVTGTTDAAGVVHARTILRAVDLSGP